VIRPLRKAHRGLAFVLAGLLPAGFALGIALRPEFPGLAGEADPAVAVAGEPRAVEPLLAAGIPVRIAGPRMLAPDEEPLLVLTPTEPLEAPDVLVYWSPAGEADRLPPAARFLGRLGGVESRAFALPSSAAGGRVYLYSLGHGALLGSAALEAGAP
jgi:hypothetical protein